MSSLHDYLTVFVARFFLPFEILEKYKWASFSFYNSFLICSCTFHLRIEFYFSIYVPIGDYRAQAYKI